MIIRFRLEEVVLLVTVVALALVALRAGEFDLDRREPRFLVTAAVLAARP